MTGLLFSLHKRLRIDSPVNHPTPAIVAQSAVQRLPRWVLLLLGTIYVLAGFIGREPWKSADMSAFGYMAELARGTSDWLHPRLLGLEPQVDALLPYWLGALALEAAPAWVPAELASRIPFMLLLALALLATWHAIYHLARTPLAQPVAFAFGGEADPSDYARAVADGGLLALLATLGLAQLSHEITPALAQLCFTAIFLYAVAALPWHLAAAACCACAGLAGLALSGAPTIAVLLGAGAAVITLADGSGEPEGWNRRRALAFALALLTLAVAGLASALDLWRWRIELPSLHAGDWQALGRLLLWFTWPVWPLALWALWRWRTQLFGAHPGPHLALPLWFAGVAIATTLLTSSSDRSLLLALPALAALAAFALPTLTRSMAALIDWFTLLFFSVWAIFIWLMWVAMQTGAPAQLAANVARLVPGYRPEVQPLTLSIAVAATLIWGWLVRWRTGRHRSALWKSVVLPAGGTVLCWLLLTTVWLPAFDYARSYGPLVRRVVSVMDQPGCVEVFGLTRAQIAAFRFHGKLELQPVSGFTECLWLIADADAGDQLHASIDLRPWTEYGRFRRPGDNNEDVLLFRRSAPLGTSRHSPHPRADHRFP